jgi:hypothetical protein
MVGEHEAAVDQLEFLPAIPSHVARTAAPHRPALRSLARPSPLPGPAGQVRRGRGRQLRSPPPIATPSSSGPWRRRGRSWRGWWVAEAASDSAHPARAPPQVTLVSPAVLCQICATEAKTACG